jgi:hypothetical protein
MGRGQRATKLLKHLQSIRHQGSQCTLTFDDSWFYWEIDWEQWCLPEDDEPGIKTRRRADHSNTMLTVAWNSNGFYLINGIPKGGKHSGRHHINNITTPICQRLIPAYKRKLVIHPDNFRCHTAKVVLDCVSQKRVRFASHPPDSPDKASFDFFFFVCLKRELRGSRFQTNEELPAKIRKLVGEISAEILLDVFHDWTARWECGIGINGNYRVPHSDLATRFLIAIGEK